MPHGSGDILSHDRGFHRCLWVFAYREYAVILQQHSGAMGAFQATDNLLPDLLSSDQGKATAGDNATKFVGHRRQHAWNILAQSREGGSVSGVGMNDSKGVGAMLIDITMRQGIR